MVCSGWVLTLCLTGFIGASIVGQPFVYQSFVYQPLANGARSIERRHHSGIIGRNKYLKSWRAPGGGFVILPMGQSTWAPFFARNSTMASAPVNAAACMAVSPAALPLTPLIRREQNLRMPPCSSASSSDESPTQLRLRRSSSTQRRN